MRCSMVDVFLATWQLSLGVVRPSILVHPSYNRTNRAETILNSLLYLRVDKQVDMLRYSQITYAHVPAFICTNRRTYMRSVFANLCKNRRKYDPKGAPRHSAQNGSKWIHECILYSYEYMYIYIICVFAQTHTWLHVHLNMTLHAHAYMSILAFKWTVHFCASVFLDAMSRL